MGVLCQTCGKEFSNSQNYSRHWRNFHENVNNNVVCSICGKRFTRKDNLQNHFIRVHEKFYRIKCEICDKTMDKHNYKRHMILKHRPVVNAVEEKQKFNCSICDSKFSHRSNLNYHKKKVHKIGTINTKIKTIKCPLCDYITKICTRDLIYSHFANDHEISMKYEKQKFNQLDEFYSWKTKIEKETKSKYITVLSKSDLLLFKCHRSGNYKTATRKRNLKVNGSCKINGFCPAFVRAKVSNDEVNVTLQPVHVGHKNELLHIRLTTEERKLIAVQLAKKVPFDEILKGIRGSLSNSPLERIHLINRKDIHNIKNSFDLSTIQIEPEQEINELEDIENCGDNIKTIESFENGEETTHVADKLSVEKWVQNLKTQNTSLAVYKHCGYLDCTYPELDEDDFLLIFMSEIQKDIFIKNSKDVVCIDGAPCLNLQLYALLIPDETREGFPAAFMFTNRNDDIVMSIFLKKIKDVVGFVTPKTFMSIDEKFYYAWKNIMGDVALHFYCSWRICADWKVNINNKIKFRKKRNQVYTTLQNLLYELDKRNFRSLLEECLSHWSKDDVTAEFYEYFNKTFVVEEQFKKWAYCYRVNSGVNTNMSIRSFNTILKYCNLKGRKKLNTLCDVLNLLRDKLFELIIKINKGKVEKKLQNLRFRHGHSYDNDSEYVIQEEDKWKVLNYVDGTINEVYTVKKVNVCNSCLLICQQCNSCFHEYICSCSDHLLKNNMCKHIHLVARTQKLIETEWDTNIVMEGNANEIGVEQISINDLPFEVRKREFIEEFIRILEEKVGTEEQLEYVKVQCQPLISKLNDPILLSKVIDKLQ